MPNVREATYQLLRKIGLTTVFTQVEDTPQVAGLDIPGLDIVYLAQGYGCTALRLTSAEEVQAAMQTALGRSGPTVLEISVSPAVPSLL